MSHFIVFHRMQVRGANFQPAGWLVAPPGPYVAMSFAHKLGLDLGGTALSVAIIHHSAELLAEDLPGAYGVLIPHGRRGAVLSLDSKRGASNYGGDGVSLAYLPEPRGNLTLSLVIELDIESFDEQDLERFKATARFAGGEITYSARLPKIVDSREEAQKLVRSGFVVTDESPLVSKTMAEKGINALEALQFLTRSDNRAEHPWLIPACIGYASISPFVSRPNARGDYQHAYVESLIGLTQLRPAREGLVFWTFSMVEKAQDTFHFLTIAKD